MLRPILYDFVFLGLGASNSLILINLEKKGLLEGKNICILEPNAKDINDKTFCFWAEEHNLSDLSLNHLVSDNWCNVKINQSKAQSIEPLNYYRVQSIDVYNAARKIIDSFKFDFHNVVYSGSPSQTGNSIQLALDNFTLETKMVFDSRPLISNDSFTSDSHLYQSFFGWEIEVQDHNFEDSTITMMDFNVPQNEFCQFMYVLPFSKDRALFELTRFGVEKLMKEEAELILKIYLENLGFKFTILDKEIGVIPMIPTKVPNFTPIKNWIKTGSNANMIKPSTGYAFYSMAEDAKMIANSVLENKDIKRAKKNTRFEFYDRLLIDILTENPSVGKSIFETLFAKVSTPKVFSFLSEKTSLLDEILIFTKLPFKLFVKAAIKDLLVNYNSSIVSILFVMFALISNQLGFDKFPLILLGFGFFTIGLSHGAVDHLTTKVNTNKLQFVKYIVAYLLKGLMLGLLWIVWPDMALLIFVLYSAWHFGQADFVEWKISSSTNSFFWGLLVLFLIIFFHLNETVLVLSSINNLKIVSVISSLSETYVLVIKASMVLISFFLAFYYKSIKMLITIFYILASAFLPLLVSFGVYFVLQHSIHGWTHLRSNLKIKSYSLWLKSLPFSIGGALLIIFFTLIFSQKYLGVFFIILSCISIPHILSMDNFYRNRPIAKVMN